MASVATESAYLSTYLGVPLTTLNSLLDSPTTELIQSVLQAVATKAREHEELKAEKLRSDIELENVVRSSETKSQGLKATIEKTFKDVKELRERLKEEENTRSTLETELQSLKSSSSTSTSDAETLRNRISNLEAANRETIAVLEAKSTTNDSLSQDLQKQHSKCLELGQQVTQLQQSLQDSAAALSSAKFREQNLQQELELAQRNNDWLDRELKTKSAEALKYRKEKGARISELQRLNEDINSNLESLKRTEQALRGRLDEALKKADDAFSSVQQLQESGAKQEEGFRQELESVRRLADLQAQQTETHRSRLREVEATSEKAKDDAAEEVGQARQLAEAESQEKEQAYNRIAELEAEVDRLEALGVANQLPASGPVTPRQGFSGSLGGRLGSPAVLGTPGSLRGKGAITATQALDELYKVKGHLATERRRNERLSAEMEEMMQGLEAKQPEIEEMQTEYTRLQQEVVEMSKFVDQTSKERDRAKKDVRKAESECSTARAESLILQQQLRDLSVQIKLLLCDLDARERGIDSLNLAEKTQLEQLYRGEISAEALEGMSDTDKFISQRLTIFRNIGELQTQNQELLRITRELGAQMAAREAEAAQKLRDHENDEAKALQVKIENYKDELQSIITRSESYIKERDMFRRMLQHRGQLPPQSDLASMFGESVDGNGLNPTQSHRDGANYAALLRELQSHFDQYRDEQAVDRRTMKEQTERLSTEKSSLQSELSKINSQYTLASERYEMLHSNYVMLQNENSELQKRSQVLSESAAKQDIRTQQVAEDLIEAKGLVESMRNENANLKAEKNLWKDIQDRLSRDNEGLMSERNRLNALIANQQSVQNERDLSETESRRRLQMQVENLEAELTTTKRKLNEETEESKKIQLRKDFDSQQNQKRIDDLVASLGSIREELVATKTSKDHLQARVDELTIELKSAEERVTVLQPRPTPRPGAEGDHSSNGVDNQEASQDVLSREQELSIEISEFKRDLELAKTDLENAKSQMEQYKSISQASEEELQSLNETQDQYREEMDKIIESKDAKINDLQQRVDDISAELTATNNEASTLRNQQSEVARRAAEDRSELEREIVRLKDEDERHSTAAQFHKQDLRAQAEIAAKAQQDYENELVKHAEAAKLLHELRSNYNILRSESATLKSEAESAKVALTQSETSWEERREQFETELTEMRTRREDINGQNKLLHQQLDDLSNQLAALQQNRANFSETMNTATSGDTPAPDRSADEARELVKYLRREKEIVEVQYELSVQDCKRLKQQFDYAQSQLDESRLKLEQERRAHADGGRNLIAHKDLMEKLNELNLFRESSITLRNEARLAQSQLAEKSQRVDLLLEQIQPLEMKVRELEDIKETQNGEMRLLQEDRDRWEKRTQDILTKYDRIDPAEMEQLKESLTSLQSERDTLSLGQQPLQEKIQALEEEKVVWQQTRTKIVEQAKERSRILVREKNERVAERDAVIQEKEELVQQLSSLRQEMDTNIQEKQTMEQQLQEARRELEAIKSQQVDATDNTAQNFSSAEVMPNGNDDQISALEQQLSDLRRDLDAAILHKDEVNRQLSDLRQELEAAKGERDRALEVSKNAIAEKDISMENGLEEGQVTEQTHPGLSEDERKTFREQIAAAEAKAKEFEDKARALEESADAVIKQRSDKMKTALNKKLAESRDASKAQLENEYQLKLEQEKQIWLAEMKAAGSDSTISNAPAPSIAPAATLEKKANAAVQAAVEKDGKPPPTPTSQFSSLTDNQIRELISTNATVKGILASNIKKKLEAETQKLKGEHEASVNEKLAEAQKKADEAKTQAVLMETKKSALKLNMMENRSRTAGAKLQIVESAAKETPEKPVGEVWEVAKNAKPPPVPAPAPSAAPVTQVTTASGIPGIPAIPAVSITSNPPAQPKQEQDTNQPTTQVPQIPNKPAMVPSGPNGNSSLPVPPAPNQPVAGPRSGLPVPRAVSGGRGGRGGQPYVPANRGGAGIGRGGGGGGRGGHFANNNDNNNQGQGNAAMNPAAQNFSPGTGNKRPREDGPNGQAVQAGGPGKRQRGGGPVQQV